MRCAVFVLDTMRLNAENKGRVLKRAIGGIQAAFYYFLHGDF